jgi:hypothetical protein
VVVPDLLDDRAGSAHDGRAHVRNGDGPRA